MSQLSYPFLMAIDRDAVLKAAVGVLSRQPTAHLDEIARAAGISRASLHRIFPGREALIREVGLLGLRRYNSALDAAAIETGDTASALRRLVDLLVPDAALCAFLAGENQLFDDPELCALWEEQDARVRAFFLRGQQEGSSGSSWRPAGSAKPSSTCWPAWAGPSRTADSPHGTAPSP